MTCSKKKTIRSAKDDLGQVKEGRGQLEANGVLNTRNWPGIKELLRKSRLKEGSIYVASG